MPKAQVYEIQSSGPAWTEQQDYCFVFVDVRLTPEAPATAIQNSLRAAIEETGVECEVQSYDYKRGFVSNNAEPLINALKDAHKEVSGEELAFASTGVISMWRDANAFNEAGIPAVGYGPGTRDSSTEGGVAGLAGVARPMAVDDLVALAKVFALTALTVCGVAG